MSSTEKAGYGHAARALVSGARTLREAIDTGLATSEEVPALEIEIRQRLFEAFNLVAAGQQPPEYLDFLNQTLGTNCALPDMPGDYWWVEQHPWADLRE